LQLPADNDSGSGSGSAIQTALAELLAHLLLEQHSMPLSKPVTYDRARLPASTVEELSNVCDSCFTNWIYDSSMSVADDRDKVAHCHACLQEWTGTDRGAVAMRRAVHHGLASRLLGST
jgi:hypothetical protein